MDQTRLSLLHRVQSGSDDAWQHFVRLYVPLIRGWFLRNGVDHHDAEELSQDVMTIVIRKIGDFTHSGRTGAFRNWLRVITVNRAREFWRSTTNRPTARGGNTFMEVVEQLGDENSIMAKSWDEEHDQYLLRQLFQLISADFEESTLKIFRRLVLDVADPETVAAEFETTTGAIYSAKSRVLRRLRREADGIIDDFHFS